MFVRAEVTDQPLRSTAKKHTQMLFPSADHHKNVICLPSPDGVFLANYLKYKAYIGWHVPCCLQECPKGGRP